MKEKVHDVLKGARVHGINFYLCFLVTSFGKLSKIEAVFHIFNVLFKCNKLNTSLFSKSNSLKDLNVDTIMYSCNLFIKTPHLLAKRFN